MADNNKSKGKDQSKKAVPITSFTRPPVKNVVDDKGLGFKTSKPKK